MKYEGTGFKAIPNIEEELLIGGNGLEGKCTTICDQLDARISQDQSLQLRAEQLIPLIDCAGLPQGVLKPALISGRMRRLTGPIFLQDLCHLPNQGVPGLRPSRQRRSQRQESEFPPPVWKTERTTLKTVNECRLITNGGLVEMWQHSLDLRVGKPVV
jgi:hypothetical protein